MGQRQTMLPLLVLLGTIAGAWYLLIVRPQKDLQTRHGRLVERLQVGDHVLTVGGIYGRVVEVEPTSVVLEMAPGLTSRIATDGIARIVHDAEAALPNHAPSITPQTALEDHMQHPPNPQGTPQPQPQVQHFPQAQLPQQPYAAVQQQPAQPPMTTIRAQVVPTAPSYEPRPWGDMAPQVAHAAPVTQPVTMQPQPVMQQQPASAARTWLPAPPQLAGPVPVRQQPMLQQSAMPVHAPFAPAAVQPGYAQPVYAAQPVHPQIVAQPAMPQHVAPVAVQHMAAPPVATPPAAPQIAAARVGSRAPQGMGSSLRLDDPSISDTIARARSERAGLAAEYERLHAPLVQLGDDSTPTQQLDVAAQAPQFVGHDATGVALFATPGVAGVHPIEQYPAAAQVPSYEPRQQQPAAMPRPHVQAPPGAVDPALQRTPFQHRTPYAPQSDAQQFVAT